MELWMSNSPVPNKQKELVNIGTPKKSCVRPMRQYGVTKYAEFHPDLVSREENITSMTNTYCCV
jgi:hypothetical protein